MILTYLSSLAIAGLILTVLLARQRSRHALTAGGGVLFGALAVLSAWSFGIFLAPVSLLLILVAAFQLGRRGVA